MAVHRLQRATPQSQGVDPSGIARLVEALDRQGLDPHSLMVLRHGKVLAEGWWAPYRSELPHMLFSVSKSITATAVGFAQDEGRLSVDELLVDVFPTYASAEAAENVTGLRVRDLLTMTTGHAIDTMEVMRALPHEDWVRIFFGVPIEYPPGTHFLYNSGASFVLAAAVTARTGRSPRDYLKERLFEPLGITDAPWEANPRGIALGASGLRLTTEDLAKIGQLYLQRGVWEGERLLSESWVDAATSKQVSNGTDPHDDWSQGYGFQIWRSLHDSFRLDGRYGQFAFVLPAQDIVVAMTAGATDNRAVPVLLWEHLLPAVDSGTHADVADSDALNATLRSRSVPLPAFLRTSPTREGFDGAHLRLPFNTLHVATVALEVGEDSVAMTTTTLEGAVERVEAGRHEWRTGRTALWPHEEMHEVTTWSRAGFTTATRLEIHQQLVDTPFRRTWAFEMNGDRTVRVTVGLDNGFWVDRTEVLDVSLAAEATSASFSSS